MKRTKIFGDLCNKGGVIVEVYRSHVLVCGGTGCVSSGSKDVQSKLEEKIKIINLKMKSR